MGAEVRRITPAVAKLLLAKNVGNRKIRDRHVTRLAHDMASGNWHFTGQPIILNGTKLLDGQHRLHAVIASGVAVDFLVISEVDGSAMPFIDRGVPRLLADTFRWAEIPNATKAATVTKRLTALRAGITLRDSNRVAAITDSDISATYAVIGDGVQWSLPLAQRLTRSIGITINEWAVAIAWVDACGADRDMLEAFVGELQTGAGLQIGSPALALRNWAINVTANRRRLRSDELLIAFVKAFNTWASGDEMRMVKVMPSESLPPVQT